MEVSQWVGRRMPWRSRSGECHGGLTVGGWENAMEVSQWVCRRMPWRCRSGWVGECHGGLAVGV